MGKKTNKKNQQNLENPQPKTILYGLCLPVRIFCFEIITYFNVSKQRLILSTEVPSVYIIYIISHAEACLCPFPPSFQPLEKSIQYFFTYFSKWG